MMHLALSDINCLKEIDMHFVDGSQPSENQEPLVIQAVPYEAPWRSGDSDNIPVTMAVIDVAMRAG